MARVWLHCHHLVVNGRKMSKSKGNIVYPDTLRSHGYDRDQIRFFLIYGHYRKELNYSEQAMRLAADQLKRFKEKIKALEKRAGQNVNATMDGNAARKVKELFTNRMDDDLDVRGAVDALNDFLMTTNMKDITRPVASGYLKALKAIDQVLQVLFQAN
jgi:cysteinyl-tRNA synthetase